MAFSLYLAFLAFFPVTFRIGLEWSTLVPKRSRCRTEIFEPCLPTDHLTPAFYYLSYLISPNYPSLPVGRYQHPIRHATFNVRDLGLRCARFHFALCCDTLVDAIYILQYNALELTLVVTSLLLVSLLSLHSRSTKRG